MAMMVTAAFLQGILAASSMAVGAVVALLWQPHRKFSAAIMAFGSGTLIAAIAFEIAHKVYQSSSTGVLISGFLVGGILFTNLSKYIDEQGGFLRKPSASRRYLIEHKVYSSSELVHHLAHSEVMQTLPVREKQQLAQLLKPHYVQPQTVLCREGEKGDFFYLIGVGTADVYKGDRRIHRLRSGDIFGEMSLLTGEPRSATVIATTAMELYRLDSDNFSQVLTQSPYLALALSRTLARRLRSMTEAQQSPEQALDQISLLEPLEPESAPPLEQLVQRSAPMAIFVGTLLDNIPEATVIGMNASWHHLGGTFLFAVFISNFPEALSSAFGMKQAGIPNQRILGLWLGVVLLSGVIAILGYCVRDFSSVQVIDMIQAIAGGAILAMLASTMMPEAYELGGSSVSYATILGFLVGFLISMAGH
ncbi:MAG: cyclic nucleotide-binding domain-containing protein [Merismopediaceae bacterium]|nr:cyclic nucleotide-binding domain-containing protein [Merismopediaceae bacterium]